MITLNYKTTDCTKTHTPEPERGNLDKKVWINTR